MSEWKEVTLGDLVTKITKGTTPPKGQGFVDKNGVNYIKSDAIEYDGTINQSKFVLIDEKTHEKFKRSQLEEGDILFSMAGNYLGKSGIVTEQMLPANTNQALAIIRLNKELALPQFIGFCFRQPNMIKYVNSMSAQSAQPNINFQEIASLYIKLPEIQEQKEIINVLRSFDKKITLLRQQNQDLEELAQTLFKHWFVEFEFPNESGEPYKSSGGKMIESEMGEIPLGWKIGKIKDIATLNDKQLSKKDNIQTIKYIDTGSLTKGVISKIKIFDNNEAPSRAKRRVKTNSILYSLVRPTQCHYGILKSIESNYIASTGFCVIDSVNHPHYLYLLLTQQKSIDYFESIANATASTYPTMRPDDIGNYEIIIPSDNVSSCFEIIADNCWQKIDNNNKEIQTLTQLRDTLLPKLMSRELRVNNQHK